VRTIFIGSMVVPAVNSGLLEMDSAVRSPALPRNSSYLPQRQVTSQTQKRPSPDLTSGKRRFSAAEAAFSQSSEFRMRWPNLRDRTHSPSIDNAQANPTPS
jgi:hypothetical protein